MTVDERREKIREGYIDALYREMESLRPSHAKRWAEDMAVELLGVASENGAVLKVEGKKVHLVSLKGDASVAEKAAYVLGVTDCTEQFKTKGFTDTAPLQTP